MQKLEKPSANMSSMRSITTVFAICYMCLLAFVPRAEAETPDNLRLTVVAKGLKFPVSMAPTADGDILVTEKMGSVRVVEDGDLREKPLAKFEVTPKNEAGLLGIATFPDFPSSGQFLVTYTPKKDLDHIYVSKLEWTSEGVQKIEDPAIKLPSRPDTDRHYGGNLEFGPDGYLFIGTGELHQPSKAQNLDRSPGSILRYNADLSIPEDNPFGSDNPIYAYGLRNPFGLTVSRDGQIFASTNGKDTYDEVNRINKAKNYGWPEVQGFCDHFPLPEPCGEDSDYTEPVYGFRAAAGLTGITIYDAEAIPEFQGDLFVGGWHTARLYHLEQTDSADRFRRSPPLLSYGSDSDTSFTDVEVAPDGSLLVLESGFETGRILRIAPASEGTSSADSN